MEVELARPVPEVSTEYCPVKEALIWAPVCGWLTVPWAVLNSKKVSVNPLLRLPLPSAVNRPAEVKVAGKILLLLRSTPGIPNTYVPENDVLLVKVPVAAPWPMASPAVEPKPGVVGEVLSLSISFMLV